MKTPSLGCHLDTIVALTASPRVACFAQMPSFLLPIFICVYVFMCGCRVLIRKACEDIKREKREGFVSPSIPPSAAQKEPPREREKRERERKRKIQKRHIKKTSFQKNTRSFLHTPGSLLLARAHERVNIT